MNNLHTRETHLREGQMPLRTSGLTKEDLTSRALQSLNEIRSGKTSLQDELELISEQW